MTTTSAFGAHAAEDDSSWAFGPIRLLLGIAMVALGAYLVYRQADVRVFEARLSRPILAVLLGTAKHPPGTDLVYYPNFAVSGGLRGLRVTLSCSSVLVVGPMLVMGGAMAMVRRFSPWRAVWAMALAATCMFVINLMRIAVIAVSTYNWGRDGYEVTHRVVGSGIVLVAATVAFVVAYRTVANFALVKHGDHR